jgi:hypothetical protein
VAGVGDGSRSLDAIRQRRQSGPQLYTMLLIVAPWWHGASVVLHRGRKLRDGILTCLLLAGVRCRGNRGEITLSMTIALVVVCWQVGWILWLHARFGFRFSGVWLGKPERPWTVPHLGGCRAPSRR